VGVLSPVEDHILLEFNTLYLTRFLEPTKVLDPPPPKQKPRRGGGLRQITPTAKVPLHVNCFRWRHLVS
jgi:hypothetical protein